jgi:PTH1 family peptidyl-tRNA hydrolase
MKYLIVGLGNIGDGYTDTRHNIGFTVLDALAGASNTAFTDRRYGATASTKYKGRELLLLKPSTFMNLSGNAVRYWLQKEKIGVSELLVIVDDLALPLGSIRLRPGGSAGGHNGLAHINEVLGTDNYARIRLGIGNNFPKGSQVSYVLGTWSPEEKKILQPRIILACDMIKSFVFSGPELTMTAYNKAGKIKEEGKKTQTGILPEENK